MKNNVSAAAHFLKLYPGGTVVPHKVELRQVQLNVEIMRAFVRMRQTPT